MTDDACADFSTFLAETSGRIIWQYNENKSQINDLYEIAKTKSWNARSDIDWTQTTPREEYPYDANSNPLANFEPFEQLSDREKLELSWRLHAIEISEILHGEQGALIIASQLISSMPTVEAKLFASSQVYDEARHVEFFSQYLIEVAGIIEPPSMELKQLVQTMINDPRWDMKFICCQILIESLAIAKFQEIKQKSTNRILTYAIDLIAKDEARHVKFGTTLLKDYISTLPQHEIQFRSTFVLENTIALANAQNIYLRLADSMGWDKKMLRYHLRKYRAKHPEVNKNRFRQLSLNLASVGLLTEETHNKLTDMNLV